MLLLCYIKNVTLQISGGAAVSAAPTKQILGVHLSPLGFAACQSKKCTNQAINAPQRGCTCLKCTNRANNAYLIITPFNQIGTEKIKESRP